MSNKLCKALATGMILAGLLTGCGSKGVDLVEGISLDESGFDGHGQVYVTSKGFADRIANEMELDYNDMNQLAFLSGIDYKIQDEKHTYNNGDTVTVKATYDENAAKKAGVKVTKDTIELKVKNLWKVYKKKSDYPDGFVDKFNEKTEKHFTKDLEEYLVTDYKWIGNYIITYHDGDTILYSVYAYTQPEIDARIRYDVYSIGMDSFNKGHLEKIDKTTTTRVDEYISKNTYTSDEIELKKDFLKLKRKNIQNDNYTIKELK